jgi:hypothetical protein
VPDDVTPTRLWRKLSDNQRLHLMNELPGVERVRTSNFVVAGRVLDRLGLFDRTSYHRTMLSAEGESLARWAVDHGYAQRTDTGWRFHVPEAPRRSRIDRNQIVELAEKGLHAAAIADELGVSREAVRQAAQRHNLTLPPKPRKPRAALPPRVVRGERVGFAVTAAELATIQQAAASAGLSVSAYLRRTVLDDDPPTV